MNAGSQFCILIMMESFYFWGKAQPSFFAHFLLLQPFTWTPDPVSRISENPHVRYVAEEKKRRMRLQGSSLSLFPYFFPFQLTNWQLIDCYLLRLTKSGISMTKALYSRAGQTLNYMLPLHSSLSARFSPSSTHSLFHSNKTKQSMFFVPCVSP